MFGFLLFVSIDFNPSQRLIIAVAMQGISVMNETLLGITPMNEINIITEKNDQYFDKNFREI
jgi:hypothetical protein